MARTASISATGDNCEWVTLDVSHGLGRRLDGDRAAWLWQWLGHRVGSRTRLRRGLLLRCGRHCRKVASARPMPIAAAGYSCDTQRSSCEPNPTPTGCSPRLGLHRRWPILRRADGHVHAGKLRGRHLDHVQHGGSDLPDRRRAARVQPLLHRGCFVASSCSRPASCSTSTMKTIAWPSGGLHRRSTRA